MVVRAEKELSVVVFFNSRRQKRVLVEVMELYA